MTIKEILDRNLFEGMTLAAGAGGIGTPVTWINIMEILDTPDTLNKGELLITTGYELSDYEKYKNIVLRLKIRGVAGMAIQLGYYIDHIPDFILDSANEHDFPILNLPSAYSFSEILQTMMQEFNRASKDDRDSLFDYNYFLDSLKQKLQGAGEYFHTGEKCRYLFCISAVNAQDTEPEKLEDYLRQLRSLLSAQASASLFEVSEGGQEAVCLSFEDERKVHAAAYDLQIQITFISEKSGINFYVGIDRLTGADALHFSLKNAVKCISVLKGIEAKRGVCPFENLTFIQMFGALYHNNRSFTMENRSLQILLAKDQNDCTNYVQTVRVYLAENCNITHTAERLFVHRHTLINRIQAISDLSGIDFNDYYTRIYLSMSLLIHDYYAM